MLQQLTMADGSTLGVSGIVPKLSRTLGGQMCNATALGQDTDEVLRGIGLSAGQIQSLKDKGIVHGAP